MKAAAAEGAFEFGPFRLETGQRLLLRDGVPVALLPKSFDALVALVRSGGLLEKDALLAAVWPNAVVEENSVAKAISDIRRALGEGPKDQRYIITVPGRGYRFGAAVTPVGVGERTPAAAVLPFSDLGAGPAHEHLAVGLADAVIGRLSRIRSLVVRPTGSVLRYAAQEKDPARAARELNVDFIVDGSIRRSGDRLRVSVQLVSAATGGTLWAAAFDEHLRDIFAVEDSIASRVAVELAPRLSGAERQSLSRRETENVEAYQLYLKGRFFWSKRTAEGCHRAIEYFERAIGLDAHYALAHVGVADSWVMLALQVALMRGEAPHETMPKARAAVAQALRIDDELSEAHASLGQISVFYEWDWAAAERAFLRSLDLNPHYLNARHWYAMALSLMQRHDDACAQMERALALDPFSPYVNGNYGRLLYFAGRRQEAVAHMEKTLEFDPAFAFTRSRMGLAYEGAGDYDRAVREYRRAHELSGGGPLAAASLGYALGIGRSSHRSAGLARRTHRALCHSLRIGGINRGHAPRASANTTVRSSALEQAVEERANAIGAIRVNPRYNPLRGEPRFERLVQRCSCRQRAAVQQ